MGSDSHITSCHAYHHRAAEKLKCFPGLTMRRDGCYLVVARGAGDGVGVGHRGRGALGRLCQRNISVTTRAVLVIDRWQTTIRSSCYA